METIAQRTADGQTNGLKWGILEGLSNMGLKGFIIAKKEVKGKHGVQISNSKTSESRNVLALEKRPSHKENSGKKNIVKRIKKPRKSSGV